ncbi:hypothetical protein EOPP23_10580 [Endozoicomonas sp. OPT23]|uniref:hypothetical protein n=1 Tax=Endozoicomonas sp. OPT23 TaxID=2072845 RepID=UPI00129B5213|nr:hypothetical protein [Endozoicomonas sp. OPT23]MRI33430.1 hypothetical protein [Endozoicomonas sp. OPT23]
MFKSEVKLMTADGAIASYEGIIRGARIASDGRIERRLIIVLSGGKDSESDTHSGLLDQGCCNVIRDKTPKNEAKSVYTRIAVIGIRYSVTTDPNLTRCAGSDNVFDAKNMAQVEKS